MPSLSDMSALADLIDLQSGVVSRAQLLDHGVDAATIRRRLRRFELVMKVPGVYVDHTGPLTWCQRAWVAVLALEPAALCHRSALRADDGPGRVPVDEVLHVAVDEHRSPAAPPGVRLYHLAGLDDKVRWNASPPRVRYEHAVIDIAAEARTDLDAIGTLADAVQSRRTTAPRLTATLDTRRRIARRALLGEVLVDIADGTCSALEHRYLSHVERVHGLPTADRQVRDSVRGPLHRDVEYPRHRLRVELDGRLFHDNATARDLDLERDLDSLFDGHATVRLGWGQVHGRPCSTARKVGLLLQRRGWSGSPLACPDCAGATSPYAGATG